MDPDEKELSQEEIMKETCKQLIEINKIPEITQKELNLNTSKEHIIGYGGQALVYSGTFQGKKVAVKVLSDVDWKSLAHELVILSNLKHENIPTFFGIVIENNVIELVFEYIEGKTLDEIPKDKLNEEEKIRLAKEICNAIDCVYKSNFIHRDLKLENIMIDSKGKGFLIDFGIAKVCTDQLGALTRAKGTIYYVAPEVFDGDDQDDDGNIISCVTHKVDVWAFGCIISYLFSGYMPWGPNFKDSEPVIQECIFKKKPFPIPNNIHNEKIRRIIEMATIVDVSKRANISQIKEILDTI